MSEPITALKREAVAEDVRHRLTSRPTSRFSEERDAILATLAALGVVSFDPGEYEHPMDVEA